MPDRKYMSHSTATCKDPWDKKLSGNAADRREVIAERYKDLKDFAKTETRRADKNRRKLKELRSMLKDDESSSRKEVQAQ